MSDGNQSPKRTEAAEAEAETNTTVGSPEAQASTTQGIVGPENQAAVQAPNQTISASNPNGMRKKTHATRRVSSEASPVCFSSCDGGGSLGRAQVNTGGHGSNKNKYGMVALRGLSKNRGGGPHTRQEYPFVNPTHHDDHRNKDAARTSTSSDQARTSFLAYLEETPTATDPETPETASFEVANDRGASQVAGGNAEEPVREETPDDEALLPSQAPPSRGDSSLVVALEVEDDPASLMEAQQVDPERQKQRKEQQRNKECKMVLYGILVVISCIILALVLWVAIGRKNERNTSVPPPPPTESPTMPPSESPSAAPSGALDLLLEKLPEYTLTSLDNVSTPQWRAMNWLANHPDIASMEESRKTQLFALSTFFNSMSGPNWPQIVKNDWMLYDKSECLWFSEEFGDFVEGSWVEAFTYNMTPCDERGDFQFLLLAYLELTNYNAFIPAEIALLTSLSVLALPLNDINASLRDFLPSQIYQMTNLTEFNLFHNTLTGSIPSDLGMLTNMIELDLQNCALTGPIPSEMGLMTSMTRLYLHDNLFSGTIPTELGRMSNMSDMPIHENSFVGAIPSELGLMTILTQLHLDQNLLSGSIPTQVGRLTDVMFLGFRRNALSGPIPSELGMLTNVDLLHLFDNSLTGTIPTDLGRMTKIIDLGININALTGSLPSELGTMITMRWFYADRNNLSGPIPSEIGGAASLTWFYLHSNNLTGSLPTELGTLWNLKVLSLSDNALSGPVPAEVGVLATNGSLEVLTLTNNSLVGTIPETLCSLGLYDASFGSGLSFDCNDQLCGCCWCPCPGSNYSGECKTNPFIPSRDDEEWPGLFPTQVNRSNTITINIRTDQYPEETTVECSVLLHPESEGMLWENLATYTTANANSVHSYQQNVESNSIYRVRLSDSYGDGTCCGVGLGWFTITNSTPSNNNPLGTVMWEATGNILGDSLSVFLSVDENGYAEQIEYVPDDDEEYAMIADETLEEDTNNDILGEEPPVVDVPTINSTLGTAADDGQVEP